MQAKKILLTIDSIQHDISPDITHAVYEGTYTCLSGTHIISYEEIFEDENHAPLKGTCLLRMSKEKITISKKGAINTKMVFETGKDFHDNYQTPFGSFPMSIQTNALSITEKKDCIQAKTDYLLNLNDSPVSNCSITITISTQNTAL